MKRKSISSQRFTAYLHQNGHCIYCDAPMWCTDPTEFSLVYGLRVRQLAPLQCTGEHLVAKQDGGEDSNANIAAACLRCNRQRHRRKKALPPDEYRVFVQKLMQRGFWHSPLVLGRLSNA